jgi:proton-translocating NADH-quinone oxidoreductase chain N
VVTGDIRVALPLVFLAGGAVAVYLVARFVASRNKLLASVTAAAFAAALAALVLLPPAAVADQLPVWGRLATGGAFLRAEPGALALAGVALGLGSVVAIYSGRYVALDQRYEMYYPLLLLIVTGLVGMLLAADVFNLYLFCELMSASTYVLVAFRRRTRTAIEAGFKYLVMGSVGTVIILAGIAFIYLETGHLVFSRAAGPLGPWTRAGVACLLVGLGLKSAIVPLHTWLPDAHGRAPSSISAMLSGVIVQSAFYAMIKVCLGWGFPVRSLGTLLMALSLLNMTVGNGMALVQTHTKRLLAYSTIAHMGYIMLSVGVGLRYRLPSAIQTGLYLILAQAAMKGLAFLCKGACHFYRDATTVDQLRGTAVRMPLVAVAFSIALAGLAGIPPLAGYTGKWLVLMDTVRASDVLGYVALGVFLFNSLLALAYYLPLIGKLFASPTDEASVESPAGRIRISGWMVGPLVTLAALALAVGLYPGPWLAWTAEAGEYLLALGR